MLRRRIDKKKDKKIFAALGAFSIILLCIFIFFGRTGGLIDPPPDGTDAANEQTGNIYKVSGICPASSSGILLCELPPEQREKEELKDRLNQMLAEKMNLETTPDTSIAKIKAREDTPAVQADIRLKASIPTYDHADLVAEKLKNIDGILVVYWSPPNIFDIKYDPSRLSPADILSESILKEYNASIVSTG
jgi:hypothetical protein